MDRNHQIQNILLVCIIAFIVLCLSLILFILNEYHKPEANASMILLRIKSLVIVLFKREVWWWFLCLGGLGVEFFLVGA